MARRPQRPASYMGTISFLIITPSFVRRGKITCGEPHVDKVLLLLAGLLNTFHVNVFIFLYCPDRQARGITMVHLLMKLLLLLESILFSY